MLARPKDFLGFDSTLVLMFVTQLGNWRMSGTKVHSCLQFFFLSIAFSIAVLTIVSHSYNGGGVFGNPSLEFCHDPKQPCTPVYFPLHGFGPEYAEPYEFCGLSWPLGRNRTFGPESELGTVSDKCEDTRLTVTDFGQLSSVAGYLGEKRGSDRANITIAYNLPGWDIVHRQVYNTSGGKTTSFVHMRRGTTDVIAVRGTSSAVEALQDLNLWMPVAFLQMARSMGPSLYSMRTVLGTLMSANDEDRSEFFQELMNYSRALVKHERDKLNHTLYMTGHSLGGGLATAVGTAVGIPAITFSAPGLGATSGTLNPKLSDRDLIHRGLNVVPDKDLVPTVDIQTGTVLKVKCPIASPFGCHRLKVTMCELLASCGDGGGRDVPRGYQRDCRTCSDIAGLHLKEQCPLPLEPIQGLLLDSDWQDEEEEEE